MKTYYKTGTSLEFLDCMLLGVGAEGGGMHGGGKAGCQGKSQSSQFSLPTGIRPSG